MKYLLACFTILSFNPYVIIYLPIRKNKRPNTFYYDDNCEYDVVFRSTKVYIKDKDLKKIVTNLKYVKWTTFKFSFDLERMKRYFHKKIKAIENIPDYKILVNADNHLNRNIAFYSFPQVWYQKTSISMVEYFFEVIRENDWSYYYNEKYDTFRCPFDNFVYYGKRRDKFTYTHPPLTLYVELYDLSIINKYCKKKVYLVDRNKMG